MSIATYGSTITPFTPVNVLPLPGEPITWDWMDVISQFSQRYLRMATAIATIASFGDYTFDYSALRCEIIPPYLHIYVRESSMWNQYIPPIPDPIIFNSMPYLQWRNIGVGTAVLENRTWQTRVVLMIAYM